MPIHFEKTYYDRVKRDRSDHYLRDIAIAEIRAGFTQEASLYGVVAYLTHLFEERPDVMKQAKSLTVAQLFPGLFDDGTGGASGMPGEVTQTRARLQTAEVSKMRQCIGEVMEGNVRPRSADEIIDEAINLYERGDFEVRISKHKWMQHFAAWRHKEPDLFRKAYRAGSNSEKDALWSLADAGTANTQRPRRY